MSASMKTCPYCGALNDLSKIRCSKCGRSIGSAATSTSSSPPLPAGTTTTSTRRSVPVPHASSTPVPAPPIAPFSPPGRGTAPVPAPAAPITPVPARWGAPQLNGVVTDVYNTRMQRPGDWTGTALMGLFGLILLPFRPLMVLMALIFRPRQAREMLDVMGLRVRDAGGLLTEARIEADIHGAGVRLGDEVALWGRYRGGVLIVTHGYNLTSGAELRLQSGADIGQVFRLMVILVIIMLGLALCSFMSSFRPFAPF